MRGEERASGVTYRCTEDADVFAVLLDGCRVGDVTNVKRDGWEGWVIHVDGTPAELFDVRVTARAEVRGCVLSALADHGLVSVS